MTCELTWHAKICIEYCFLEEFIGWLGKRIFGEVASYEIVADFNWTNQVNLVFRDGFNYHALDSVKYHLWPIDFGTLEFPKIDQVRVRVESLKVSEECVEVETRDSVVIFCAHVEYYTCYIYDAKVDVFDLFDTGKAVKNGDGSLNDCIVEIHVLSCLKYEESCVNDIFA